MQRKSHRTGRFLFRLLLLALAGWALSERRPGATLDEPAASGLGAADAPSPAEPVGDPVPRAEPPRRFRPRRIALGAVLAALFFAGAAFTAAAGNEVASALGDGVTTTSTTAQEPEAAAPAAPEEPAAAAPAAPSEPAPADPAPAAAEPAPASEPAPAETVAAAPVEQDDPIPSAHSGGGGFPSAPAEPAGSAGPDAQAPAAARPSGRVARADRPVRRLRGSAQWVLARSKAKRRAHARGAARPATAHEEAAEVPGAAPIVWLDRVLPDPTPPSRRLDPAFARRLVRISRRAGADWALVLGLVRARGANSSVPASRAELRGLAARLGALRARDDWNAVLALTGRPSTADEAIALASYNRAVGLASLVDGLKGRKDALTQRLLDDGRVDVYPGGRDDLAAGRVDVRVVVLIEYLAETLGQVRVSCLVSGHRLFARPGVVSAHIYGDAVDVAAVGGVPIFGHQEPGGITERAVRAILLLPSELQPKQVISLLGLGGPSFPLADHDDHVHVGY